MSDFTQRTLWHSDTVNMPYAALSKHRIEQMKVTKVEEANLISSLLENGKHSPLLDLDVRHNLVASATQGHAHLYIDGVELSWQKYRILLWVLKWCNIIQPGYYKHSIMRKMTMVRTPDKKKIKDVEWCQGVKNNG